MTKQDKTSILCVPLGGCGQFGANMTVYGHAGRLIAIDCGIGFADDYYPGIDILMPDVNWLAEEGPEALVITHAHEDHIGAVAWLWPRLKCPIYVTPFAARVLEKKFAERAYDEEPDIRILPINDSIDIGPFTIETLSVTHSIPETLTLMLSCDAGRIVHTGDWNLDPTPVIGQKTNMNVWKKWGENGVLAVIGDSTNAPVEGRSASESQAAEGLASVFQRCPARIAVTIFSSNIARIISIYKAAKACDRNVGLIGRSLKSMVDNAREAGIIPDDMVFVAEEDLGHLPKDKIVMIVTGSQGEGRAALSKIARGMNRDVVLNAGDTVVFSARSIPGNERDILDVKNLLSASGVRVIDPGNTTQIVHVSGHPKRDELKDMLHAIKPQIVIPVHGEFQMQDAFADLAREEIGALTHVPDNGTMMRISQEGGVEVIDHLDLSMSAIDFNRVVPMNDAPLLQRKRLSLNGVVLLSVTLDEDTLSMIDLQITTLGLVDEESDFGRNLVEQTLDALEGALEKLSKKDKSSSDSLVNALRPVARRPFKNVLGARPAVEIHIIYA